MLRPERSKRDGCRTLTRSSSHMKTKSPYFAKPGKKIDLSHWKSDESGGFKGEEASAPVLLKHRERLSKLQEVLYAGEQRAILIVLQGMDTAGKDGTIRHIFSGINPQGCDVTAFKIPTPLESRHDFLWRAHNAAPPRGMIGIFNRSHYEDVLSPRGCTRRSRTTRCGSVSNRSIALRSRCRKTTW